MARPQIKMGASISDYHLVKMDESACLSLYASICGDVSIGAETSVFAGTQIRGDCEPIVVGERTNIQENSCLHVSAGSKLTVGNHVTVGHMAMLHGCTIDDNVLVGMGSIVMDDAHISSDCVIAAGSLVTQGKEFPPRSLIMGSPAKVVRTLTDEEVELWVTVASNAYVEGARAMLNDGLMVNPPAGANVWPMPQAAGDLAPGMFIGGMF